MNRLHSLRSPWTIRRILPAPICTSSLYSHVQKRTWTTITRTPAALTIHALDDASFPYLWLRDSCQSPLSVHPAMGHKLHRTTEVPMDISPLEGEEGVRVTDVGVEIVWSDGHSSFYEKEWLERYGTPGRLESFRMDDELRREAWTQSSISSLPDLFIPYSKIQTDEGLAKGIVQLAKRGLLLVRGVPNGETSFDKCELRALAERFGELRKTFYGDIFDVVNLKESWNIAYTNEDLGYHMDLVYFEHPPRFQILHCLRNKVVGGTSKFVDGLRAAQVLRSTHPEAFDILSTTPVSFRHASDKHYLHREQFTIELAPLTSFSAEREISYINYAPPFQAPLPLNTPKEFYAAFRRFEALLNDPKSAFEYTLKEGDAVLFDNRRLLHSRTAFRDMNEGEGGEDTSKLKDGEPNRWLQGCYVEVDALMDRVRVLRMKQFKRTGSKEAA